MRHSPDPMHIPSAPACGFDGAWVSRQSSVQKRTGWGRRACAAITRVALPHWPVALPAHHTACPPRRGASGMRMNPSCFPSRTPPACPCFPTDTASPKYWDPTSCVYTEWEKKAFCTDPTAENYNSWATTSSNTVCTYRGCNDTDAINTVATSTFFDGTCQYDRIGCTDPTAANYADAFTLSCQFALATENYYCSDDVFDCAANMQRSACIYQILVGITLYT